MNLHTADPMQPHDDSSSAAAAGDKRKREVDDAADPVVKKERSSGGGGPADAAMVQAPTNGQEVRNTSAGHCAHRRLGC